MKLKAVKQYELLLDRISETYEQGRSHAAQAINSHMVVTYWNMGKNIVEFEQGGSARAEYGKALIDNLARDLTLRHGKGFSRSNLIRFRQFYLAYPKSATVSHQLSWSSIVELLKIEDPQERGFYEKQAIAENWSVRELIRQKESALFLRLAVGKGRKNMRKLALKGQTVKEPKDLLREPYIFEFLKIPEPYRPSETQLETLLCDHLQQFLMELGKGFTFVGRQYRITVNKTANIPGGRDIYGQESGRWPVGRLPGCKESLHGGMDRISQHHDELYIDMPGKYRVNNSPSRYVIHLDPKNAPVQQKNVEEMINKYLKQA